MEVHLLDTSGRQGTPSFYLLDQESGAAQSRDWRVGRAFLLACFCGSADVCRCVLMLSYPQVKV